MSPRTIMAFAIISLRERGAPPIHAYSTVMWFGMGRMAMTIPSPIHYTTPSHREPQMVFVCIELGIRSVLLS